MHAHLQQPIVRPSTSWIILFWSIPEGRIYSLITSYQQLSVIIRLLSERFFSKTTGLVEKRDEFQTIDSWHLMPCQPQSYLGEEFQMKNVTGLLSWIVYNWEKKNPSLFPTHNLLATPSPLGYEQKMHAKNSSSLSRETIKSEHGKKQAKVWTHKLRSE